jgi:hypothetical protein
MLQGAQRSLRSQIEVSWLVSSDGPSRTMDFRELEGKGNTQTMRKFDATQRKCRNLKSMLTFLRREIV